MQFKSFKTDNSNIILTLLLSMLSLRLMKWLINVNLIISIVFFFRLKMLFNFILIESVS